LPAPKRGRFTERIYNDSLERRPLESRNVHLLIRVAVILPSSATRADEETGRDGWSTRPRWPDASLTAAWVWSCGASLTTGALGAAAGLLGNKRSAGRRRGFGAAWHDRVWCSPPSRGGGPTFGE